MTQTHLSRRTLLAVAAAAAAAPSVLAKSPPAPRAFTTNLADSITAVEQKAGGRLGVFLLDAASGRSLGHRKDERFAMCSTFKMPLAAAILQRADQGKLSLDTFVRYTKADIVAHAPVAQANLAKGGMTIVAMAEAAQKQSDNAAANLLLKQIGGPQGLTQFLRDIGDTVTHLDRYEPEMNDVAPGDERDTTTPAAMAATAAKILTGAVLSPKSRDMLTDWMIATTTGAKRIRAGLPQAWRAGDKTGTMWGGRVDYYNDVAIVWPTGKAPVIITAFYSPAKPEDKMRDETQAVLAEVGRIATAWIGA